MRTVRSTIQKDLVLRAVGNLKIHPTAEEIYAFVRSEHPSISRGTVYRNLSSLSVLGEVKRIEVPNAADRFDFNTESHYHMFCKSCLRVFDIKVEFLEGLDNTEVDGFKIESHDLLCTGKCPDCIRSNN